MAIITKQQVKVILDNAPPGTTRNGILDNLLMRGYDFEGIDPALAQKRRELLLGQKKQQEDQTRGDAARGGSDSSWGDLPGHILPSLGNMAKGIGSAIIHPIKTIDAVTNAAAGGLEKGAQAIIDRIPVLKKFQNRNVPEGAPENDIKDKNTATFDAVTQFFKDRYGSLDNAKKTMINDPAGFALDLSTLFSGGSAALGGASKVAETAGAARAAEVLGKVSDVAETASRVTDPVLGATKAAELALKGSGKLAAGMTGLTTGRGAEAVETAFKSTNPKFTEMMRSEGSKADLVNTLHEGLQTLRQQRAGEYQSRLEEIGKNKTSLDMSPVITKLDEQLAKFNIKKAPDGTFDFSRSTISSNEGLKDVQGVIQTIEDWGSQPGDRTPLGLDILKRRLGDFYSDSGQARALVKSVSEEVKGILNKEVPGYSEMTRGYAQTTDLIEEVEKTFSAGGKAATETTVNKLLSSLRGDKELRSALIKQVEEATNSRGITDQIAATALNDWLPPGLAGKMFGAGGVSGSFFSPSLFMGIVTGLASLSPRIVGEFARALGWPYRQTENFIEAVNAVKRNIPGIENLTRPQIDALIFQAGRAGDIPLLPDHSKEDQMRQKNLQNMNTLNLSPEELDAKLKSTGGQ
jgi:hypothetical protein